MSERLFDRKVKQFHELCMGSMTMDAFINRFSDLLHYVPYIKDEKLKIEQFLRCLPPNFQEMIEFDMPETLDTTLQKYRIYYEHGQPRQENMNRSRDKSKNFYDIANRVLTHPCIGNKTIVFQQKRTSKNQVQSHMYNLQMLSSKQKLGEPMLPQYRSNVGNGAGLIMPDIVRTRSMGSCTTYKKNQQQRTYLEHHKFMQPWTDNRKTIRLPCLI